MADNRFCVDYAKRQAGCKKCKQKIEKGEIRIAKVTASPFSDDGEMKHYYHPQCIFETFKKARASTKIIEDPSDLEGWQDIQQEDKDMILRLMKETERPSPSKKAKVTPPKKTPTSDSKKISSSPPEHSDSTEQSQRGKVNPDHKDNSFRQFRRLCFNIEDNSSYLDKSAVVRTWFEKGTGEKFQGDLHVWVRLLLPGVIKRVYNMQNKQMVKIFSRIFSCSEEEMVDDLENGDVAETVASFFEEKSSVKPPKKSDLTIHDVDDMLSELTEKTKEDEQEFMLKKVVRKSTVNDLRMFVRLIKGDLRIQAGAKHILDGVHHDAYDSFNSTRNITAVLDRVIDLREKGDSKSSLDLGASLLVPVQPMLAAPCKSIEMAFKKCPNGIFSEIKYDGERVQLHKQGRNFKYFSRSLKPVQDHKVKHFAEHIPLAFPSGGDMILDAEVLMVSNKGVPLPFGSLGIHKGSGFKDANPCLFVFDIMHYNGENLMNKPMRERRKLLEKNMVEKGNFVKFSELTEIKKKSDLTRMIKTVLEQGLEGLVLKDAKSTYEPGKRHWLKVKKDYLNEGAMADTADLVVLGGWYGSGSKGGLVSVWLMGSYDSRTKKWCTVTKVGNGFDDDRLTALQEELLPQMKKIKQDYDRVPSWLNIKRQMVPDVVAMDPQQCPVWEITGAEFSKAELHTAGGISIRFPRVTKERTDKTWATATNLEELRNLYDESKNNIDININTASDEEIGEDDLQKKRTSDSPVKGSSAKKAKEGNADKNENSYTLEDKMMKATIPTEKRNISSSHQEVPTSSGFSLAEVRGDLFTAPGDSSLCHCVSRDFRLGKGIAKLFRDKFGRIDELKSSGAKVGEVAVLKEDNRFIYNLVTKEVYSGKPTYDTLRRSLEMMKDHAVTHGVTNISMPLIGCGLDGLSWPAVRTLVKEVFLKEIMRITVYSLDQGSSSSSHSKNQQDIATMFSKGKQSSKKDSVKQSKLTSLGFGYSTTNPLPDVFTGMKIHVSDQVKEKAKLERYLISYGGRTVAEYQLSQATHIVYSSEDREVMDCKGAKHVSQLWLEDSIKLKQGQDERLYKFKQ